MRKLPAALLLVPLLLICFPLAAQTGPSTPALAAPGAIESERLLLAVSNENYPATPGDVYTLTYQLAGKIVTFQTSVQGDYELSLGVFGNLTAVNFSSLRKRVVKIVLNAYPGSVPSFTISSIGIFQVSLQGFVPSTRYITAWGLSRLSEVVKDNLGPHSSVRDIAIRSVGGQAKKYDLFKGTRGVAGEDPYVKPGDTIIVSRADREVRISGEVYRSGAYQLTDKDDLKTVVEDYAGGLTVRADPSRIRIDRVQQDGAKVIYLDTRLAGGAGIALADGDSVVVPSILDNLPVVFFEGAIEAGSLRQQGTATQGIGFPEVSRLTFSYEDGETLQNALHSIRDRISALADLSHAYIIRANPPQLIQTDLSALLYTDRSPYDVRLQPFDRIVIPVNPSGVSVAGAVAAPGWYAFVPEKTYIYYLELAGAVPLGETARSIAIYNSQGIVQDLVLPLQPGDRIMVTRPTISVSGAVITPGSYPFVPAKPATYYIGLAGGVDRDFSGDGRFVVTTENGKLRPPNQPIEVGESIYLPKNEFTYSLNQILPFVSNTVTIAADVFTIIELLRQH